jgi:EmrB/QacA subfamily drug resistance transporter
MNESDKNVTIDMPKTANHYRRKWLIMAAIGMGIFLATIDGSIVNVALPTLVKSFQVRFAVVQWVVLGYLLTVATLLLSIGRLADIIGKKPLYLAGMIIFTLFSLLCGLAQSIFLLIAFRVMQGIGAAMMMALGTGIVAEAFPFQERGKAMGIIGSIVSVGIITGPTLGGLLIDLISWHWIFFVNIPVGIIGSLMVYSFLPRGKIRKEQRFDFYGAATLLISLMAFLLAVTLGQQRGFTDIIIIILFTVWGLFFLLFLLIEFRIDQPMVDMNLFRNKLFSLNLFTGFLIFVSMGGTILLMPFYLQNVLGYTPHQVGLLLVTVPLAAGIVSPFSGSLSDRYGNRKISTIGLFFILMGFSSMFTLNTHTTSLAYILCYLPVGIGVGTFQSPNNSAILSAAPLEKLGVASSLLSLTRTLGQTSGVAVLGAFWVSQVAIYAGEKFELGSVHASPLAQVAGLHDTILIVMGFILLALLLNLCALVCARRVSKSGNSSL